MICPSRATFRRPLRFFHTLHENSDFPTGEEHVDEEGDVLHPEQMFKKKRETHTP